MRGRGDRRRSYAHVTELFNQTFRNENNGIFKITVIRIVQRFEETGFVKDRNRQGRPAIATNPDKRLNVLQSFIEDPRNSVHKVAQQHDINPMSVHKILKKEKFHPYKIHLAQELCEDDFDRRIEFCESMMLSIDRNLLLVDNITFSDEANRLAHCQTAEGRQFEYLL
ncbi:hypothetical protein ALC57_02225 [Trachymyrmex cornetzi]|uniref:DUF4817 domain-containing protein n=1 Tax=Trachymyrmex cornetzi TaxID=471704 RepID=A0A151JNZ5_9HYME|nr:hypothetical protein ALC57_02225 [Trachymyrmex cornetzi]